MKRKRIENLRERFIQQVPEICVERAVLVTKSYQETENEPVVLRRAKAVKKVLEEMTIFIDEDELIVGSIASKLRRAPIYPEFSVKWILDELDTFANRGGDKLLISEENKKVLREILPYWVGKTIEDKVMYQVPDEVKDSIEYGAFSSYNMVTGGVGHYIPDYGKVLTKGIKGIKDELFGKLKKLNREEPENISKKNFYEAAIIACDGAVKFAHRYAEKALMAANEEKDPTRKEELKKIAAVCQWVPENPARTFYEALQAFWFTHLMPYIESNGLAISPGRFDQYVYPYLKNDLESGRLTMEEAQELLECLFLKFPNIIKLYNNKAALSFGGFPTNSCLILGGQTKTGEDATNELSYMCLQATANTKLTDPSLAVRFHKFAPEKFMKRTCEVIRIGTGMPKVFNDEVIIPALLNRGVTLEDARDYGIVGCVEPAVGGKTYAWCNAGYFNLAKCLELALTDGKCLLTGKQMGIHTGNAQAYTSIEDVLNAYQKQVSHFVKLLVQCLNTVDIYQNELAPLPFSSCLFDDCVERGMDLNAGGAKYNFTSPQGVGTSNVGDSLAAIKKLVFEDKTISMNDLLDAINHNFEGYETLRQTLLNHAPKYGNDDDYVDLLAKRASSIYCCEVEKYRNPRGGQFQPGLYPVTANVPMGKVVGASADGRKAGEPLADGVSPVQGRDIMGPTATMKSVAKLEHIRASNGTLLNLKLTPAVVSGEVGLGKFVKLLRGYIGLGGWHVQFNIIEPETLINAQKNPEEYRGLVVRVAGYSAFFVELDKSIQDDIIARTSHATM